MIENFKPENELDLIDPTYIQGDLDNISNPNILHQAYIDYKKGGVSWKESVQHYGINELKNIAELHNAIENGTYKESKPYTFILNERGHTRYIKSNVVEDKVVQNALNKNVLEPRLQPLLIYDNGASQKDKGISFSRARFENHLRNAYKEFNSDGYILIMDFSKYFDNILHSVLLEQIKPYLNPAEYNFMINTIKSFEVDVSYMSDEEYEYCIDTLFNSLDHNNIDKSRLTGAKMMAKSVPIGSHTSQISGLFYPHEIDNYCKIVKGIKYYGRYMDDTYIIMKNKEDLWNILSEIKIITNRLGIFINDRKTRIIPLNAKITYLKINYFFNNNGRLIRKINSETLKREYRRLYKYKHLLDNNKITLEEIKNCYKSWRGSYIKFDSGIEILELDRTFTELFGVSFT